MNKTAENFMKAAVLYALSGITLGIAMAASHDFGMSSAHAHLSLLGWVSMALFAFYYQLVPYMAEAGVAKAHFWISNFGVVTLTGSVFLIANGYMAAEAGAVVGAIALLVAMLIFAYVVFAAKECTHGKHQMMFCNSSTIASLGNSSKHI